jgi:hypothetical protein
MIRLIATPALVLSSFGLLGGDIHNKPGEIYNEPSVFMCEPAVVTLKDTLVITKRSSMLRELAVRRPNATGVHFLIVGSPPPEMSALMTPEEFSQRSVVEIRVSDLVGLEWAHGATSERISVQAGTYTFVTSSVLESDVGGAECHVEYVGNAG